MNLIFVEQTEKLLKGISDMKLNEIEIFLQKVQSKLTRTSELIGAKFPYTTTNGKYEEFAYEDDIYWWTNGFWVGIMWKMFLLTGDDKYKNIATECENKLDAALNGFEGLHHDVGFMWILSAVADYKLTKNPEARKRGLIAANYLMGRFNINGNYIRAWNGDAAGVAIIDSMMNIPILSWAAKEENDPRYIAVAKKHADTINKYYFDEEGASAHIVVFDPETGEFVKKVAGQGYSDSSAWSRGQSWAIYGFTLAYINLGDELYLERAKKSAKFFMEHVGEDNVPDCDFRAPKELVKKDTSAGAIAACGLLELAKIVSEEEKDWYIKSADRLLSGLIENCDFSLEEQSILQNGSLQYHGTEQTHIPLIYGDYYLVEALQKRLFENEVSFWK